MNAAAKRSAEAVDVKIHPLEKIDKDTVERKNVGCSLALAHYNALGIEKVLRNKTRKSRVHFDINAVMRLLVCDRILNPGSKLAAWEKRSGYFFRSEFSDDDIYRSLDTLALAKDSVIAAMNKHIALTHGRDLTNIFYDVTNYYFEIDREDGLRKKGVSKEKRRKPIVQMGLVQDARGIPLNFETFAGNTHDAETMIPVMSRIKDQMNLERVIVVADKGLNSSENIAALVGTGNGFIFSQSCRGTKSSDALKAWVTSEAGYKAMYGESGATTFKIKSRQDFKEITLDGEISKKTGRPKRVKVKIDVQVVAFWSAKYAHRARKERERVLEKSRALIKDSGALCRATSYGAAKYVKNISFDKDTGEIIEDAAKLPVLDEERIAAEEALDGYYVIITSETGMDPSRVVDTYRELWRIEESFKITKSCLSARPVYVSTRAHIEAHFLICYIALTIMRLIQLTTGFAYSAETIARELAQMDGVHIQDNWWRFAHRNDTTDALCQSVGIDLTRKNMRLEEIKGILAKVNHK
jgi:transposase